MRANSIDGASPRAAKILGDIGRGGVQQARFGNDDEIGTEAVRARKLLAEHLSNQAFSSISRHGTPEFPGCHQTETRGRTGVGNQHEREIPTLHPAATLEHLLIFAAATDTSFLWEAA